MFKIVKRLIDWTGQYKKRIYIGFIYAFLHSIFTAIPIMLATYGLSAVLDDFNGKSELNPATIWLLLIAMIVSVLGRFLFSYLRAITQDSVGSNRSRTNPIGGYSETCVPRLFQSE